MRTAIININGVSPYSASKVFENRVKNAGESFEDHENRCWRERLNVDSQGVGIIPPMAFAWALQVAAKRYAGKIVGKGNATWTKHFESGLLVVDALPLGVTRADVQGEWLFVPSDGVRGSGKRVMKCFPIVHKWGGDVTVHVLDDEITPAIFAKVADVAFKLVGVGRFRPERCGFYGRAEVKSLKWVA
jgi:hypothetical protein